MVRDLKGLCRGVGIPKRGSSYLIRLFALRKQSVILSLECIT